MMRGLFHEFDGMFGDALTAIDKAMSDGPFVRIMDEVHDPIDSKVRLEVVFAISSAMGFYMGGFTEVTDGARTE